MSLPTEAQARKDTPIASGVLDYFPDALAEVARVSKAGNDQHNPGQPLHWEKGKSTDHADCIVRHLLERGTFDTDGMRHSAKVAWRALALLQTELEGLVPEEPREDDGRFNVGEQDSKAVARELLEQAQGWTLPDYSHDTTLVDGRTVCNRPNCVMHQ